MSLVMYACGDSENASVDAGVATDMSVSDAVAADATGDAATEAQATIGEAGGSLELLELHFVVPENAVPNGTALEVTVSDVDPGVEDVTPITSVYEFGPDGTAFTSDVFVSFDVPDLAEGAIPIVYWTNDAGEFEEQATWWSDGRVHALTRHLSRAFVGTSTLPRLSLLCKTQPTVGRGVCLKSAAVGSNEGGTRAFAEARDVVATLLPGASGTLTIRNTPVHPGAVGLPSLLTIYDIDGTEISGLDNGVQICFRGTLTDDQMNNTACLGFYNEMSGTWECQDECLTQSTDTVCGKTDHFTSFAILLTGRNSSMRPTCTN